MGKLPYSPRQKSSRFKRIRDIIFISIFVGIFLYLVLGGPYGVINLCKLRNQKIRMERKTLQLKGERVLLKQEINGLKNDTFTIEKLAREKLGMIKDGEIIIEIEDSSRHK